MLSSTAHQRNRLGIALSCPICKHDRFHEREYAFRSPIASFFNHYWSADKVVAYVCTKCGNMLTFAEAKPEPKVESAPAPMDKAVGRVL